MVSTDDITQQVKDSIEDIPTTVDSGTNIYDWVNKARIFVQNYTGNSINEADVPERFQGVLWNLGCAYTLSKMIGTGVDFDAKLGEFDVKKGTRETPQGRQMKTHLTMANNDMKNIGHKIGGVYAKVNG